VAEQMFSLWQIFFAPCLCWVGVQK
jgi:hypothetical protein